jgi:hypothetical protein
MPSDAIIQALEAQLELYRRLMKLAELQHECVVGARTDELVEVLKLRREAMEEVAALEPEVTKAREDWNAFVEALGTEDKSRFEEVMSETRQLLKDLANADCNDAMVLQQRMLNVGKQINQASAARQVNRSYATAAYGKTTTARVDVSR